MQTRNPFIDDLTKMANGAMGALSGVKDEVEARVRDQIAKILDGMDIPRRDEFEAVKAMAAKAREENEELKKQIAELQARLLNTGPLGVSFGHAMIVTSSSASRIWPMSKIPRCALRITLWLGPQ